MENGNKKNTRRAAFYAAMEALYDEILDLESALSALELVYFGKPTGDGKTSVSWRSAHFPAPPAEKRPRGSTPPKRKGPGKGRGRKNLSQTPAAKLAREYRAKQKAKADQAPPAAEPEAGQATSAHEALKAQSQAEIEKDKGGDFPRQRKGSERQASPASADNGTEAGNPGRKPTVPPVETGSLTGLTQQNAIRAILRRAARQLDSSEILERLRVGGYKFRSDNPRRALSVTLATMGGELMTETRAGRLHYDPIKTADLEGGEE